MMADAVPPQFKTWSHVEGRDPVRPSCAEGLARLEALRTSVHRWLDRLESLAREHLAALATAAEKPVQPVDEIQTRFHNEIAHWEQSRQAQLDELEQDRRLLAEAWERLERERAEARSDRWAGPNANPSTAHPPTVRLASHTGDSDSPVSQAILRQFEALRRDVRRTAETRRPG